MDAKARAMRARASDAAAKRQSRDWNRNRPLWGPPLTPENIVAKRGHHGHTYCGGLCVPHFLHEQFAEQLGPRVNEFDLLAWYPRRDAQRKLEMIVIEEPLTWWRDAFKAELGARGWIQPRKPKPEDRTPVQTERLSRLSATFGRTKEETQRQLQEMLDYRRRHAPVDSKMKQAGE